MTHSAFLNSKQSGDRETDKFYKFTYLMSEQEIKDLLKLSDLTEEDIEEGLNNTVKIANSIENYDFRHSTIIPAPKIPSFTLNHLFKNWYDKFPSILKFSTSNSLQDQYLLYQIEEGFKQKGGILTEEKVARINTELDVIDYISNRLNQSLSAYLNLTVDMVNIAWQVSLVGCGRGSACGFYINYLIGATQVDPLKYNLPYWRFANKERVDMMDIDEDYQPEKTEEIIQLLRKVYGEDNVLNCATFKTESLKSAVLTACRGLEINNDEAQAIAAMVPQHRGKTYTLEQCEFGDEEQGFEPVPQFINKLKEHDRLYDIVKNIEGLPTNASIHASALYVFNNGYLDHNSLMRAPNGTPITAFNMHDSDDMGALKMDVLRTDAQSKMAKCLELLLKDKQIQWQGSLRDTYNKYLHPDILDYDTPSMWEKAWNGQIEQLFQFETQVGGVCIKKAQPTNVTELAEINSIMRLQSEGKEQPIDKYVRFRHNIQEWYKEMRSYHLTDKEITVLEKYLKKSYGISGSQEVLMQLVMDPSISGYTLGEANAFRKAIAKKITAKILENKEKFFQKTQELGTSENMANYCWTELISPQLGYSFSLNHTLPYSVIAVQEMNLATKYNPLYWSCACLCVNAGNININFDQTDIDEGISEDIQIQEEQEETTEVTKNKTAAPNYGKISKAITDSQLRGVNIELPDINKAELDFIPDIENNGILYSLKMVSVVSDDLYDAIIAGRPYTSIQDFYTRIKPTLSQMIGLIKAGCFDHLAKQDRRIQMSRFITQIAEQEYPIRDKITMVQLKKALKNQLKYPAYEKEIRMFHFKSYIQEHQIDKNNKRYVLTEDSTIQFFVQFLEPLMNLSKGEYSRVGNSVIMKISMFEKYFKQFMSQFFEYLNSEEGRKEYQEWEKNLYIQELQTKYDLLSSVSAWEMDQMSFYHSRHELSTVLNSKYNIRNFEELPENPLQRQFEKDGITYNTIDNLCGVAGTVVNADNIKHIVSLLTPYGVVNVKMYGDLYNKYKARLSKIDSSNKKILLDESWFKRGTKLLVYGYRRENSFVAKNIKINGYPRCVCLIEQVNSDGTLQIRFNRKSN